MKLSDFWIWSEENERLLFAADYLEKCGYNRVKSLELCEFALLPVPTKKYMLDSLGGKFALYGGGEYENGINYMKNEKYVLKNAFLTAEGAVAALENENADSLIDKNILIIGYGRIAKALHRLLAAYGSNITVCSRSAESAELSNFYGASHIYFPALKKKNDFDIVINTVPHIVLTEAELKALKKSVIILDLASFPGGADTLVAASLGLKIINGRGMPSKFTAKAAGEAIGCAADEIIRQL